MRCRLYDRFTLDQLGDFVGADEEEGRRYRARKQKILFNMTSYKSIRTLYLSKTGNHNVEPLAKLQRIGCHGKAARAFSCLAASVADHIHC
jgi:hypothetical protein